MRQVVLLYDTERKKDMSWKVSLRWLRPYKICNAVKDKGTYLLEELDGSYLAGTFSDNKLKKFHPWQRLHLDHAFDLDLENLLNLDDFFLNNGNSDLSDVHMTSLICNPAILVF